MLGSFQSRHAHSRRPQPPLDRDPRQLLQDGLAVALAAALGQHEKVLQIDAAAAEERREVVEEKRKAHVAPAVPDE
jgi:hypothetical protein